MQMLQLDRQMLIKSQTFIQAEDKVQISESIREAAIQTLELIESTHRKHQCNITRTKGGFIYTKGRLGKWEPGG